MYLNENKHTHITREGSCIIISILQNVKCSPVVHKQLHLLDYDANCWCEHNYNNIYTQYIHTPSTFNTAKPTP